MQNNEMLVMRWELSVKLSSPHSLEASVLPLSCLRPSERALLQDRGIVRLVYFRTLKKVLNLHHASIGCVKWLKGTSPSEPETMVVRLTIRPSKLPSGFYPLGCFFFVPFKKLLGSTVAWTRKGGYLET
jgi:hypothetical protein